MAILAGPEEATTSSWPMPALPGELPSYGGRVLYVGTNGSDWAPGTLDRPMATLNNAARVLGGGGTILVLPGNYSGLRLDASLATNLSVQGLSRPCVNFGQKVSRESFVWFTGKTYTAEVDTNHFSLAVLRQGVDEWHYSYIAEWGTKEGPITPGERNPLQAGRDFRLDHYRLRSLVLADQPWSQRRAGSLMTLYFVKTNGLAAGDYVTVSGLSPAALFNGTFRISAAATFPYYTTITYALSSDPGLDPTGIAWATFVPNIVNCPNGTWTITNATLYVNFSDGGGPRDVYLPECRDRTQCLVYNCRPYSRLHIRGFDEYFGYEGIDLTSVGYAFVHSCRFIGNADEGVTSFDPSAGSVVLSRVECAANDNDGMGYEAMQFTTNQAQMVYEYQCWSHDNADEGTSAHYTASATCIGGLYEFNQSGGITPYAAALNLLSGCTSRFNAYGIFLAGNPSEAGIALRLPPALWSNAFTRVRALECSFYGNLFGLVTDPASTNQYAEFARSHFDNSRLNIAAYSNRNQVVVLRDCSKNPAQAWTGPYFMQPTILKPLPPANSRRAR